MVYDIYIGKQRYTQATTLIEVYRFIRFLQRHFASHTVSPLVRMKTFTDKSGFHAVDILLEIGSSKFVRPVKVIKSCAMPVPEQSIILVKPMTLATMLMSVSLHIVPLTTAIGLPPVKSYPSVPIVFKDCCLLLGSNVPQLPATVGEIHSS